MKGPKPPEPRDLRSTREKEAADASARASIEKEERFAGYRAQEDFGYDTQRLASLDPAYSQARENISEQYSQLYARGGFGPNRVGPQAASTSREFRKLEAGRAANEATDRGNWRRFVETSGTSDLPPVPGPQIFQPQPRGPSQFAQLLGSAVGNVASGATSNIMGGGSFAKPAPREFKFLQ